MVSSFRRMGDQSDTETMKLLSDMIDKSGNEAADWLMNRVIDPQRAPLQVSEDMKALGLQNTFLAGYFSFGSPLLAMIQTPANQRTDINTDPDPYSQTTPSDIGMLLEDIYQCAQDGGGALPAVFPGEITQTECQAMNSYLIKNRLPVLLTGWFARSHADCPQTRLGDGQWGDQYHRRCRHHLHPRRQLYPGSFPLPPGPVDLGIASALVSNIIHGGLQFL